MITPADTVEQHFTDLLMPRNHGLIAVMKLKTNELLVCLSYYPFLKLSFNDGAIVLLATYPECVAVWNSHTNQFNRGDGPIIPFSRKPKKRAKEIATLAARNLNKGTTTKFDLCEPDSIGRAEFYVQTIISKVKYMISNGGYYGHKPKADIEFTDLIEAATIDFNKKVLVPRQR